jgi:exopolysaccharide production protein ExoZ
MNGKTLFTVQALRAVAAGSVALHHTLTMLNHTAGYTFGFPSNGAAGVDLFFLISGFVMVYTHFNDFAEPGAAASFARRRVIRIVPLYWAATTVTVVLLIVAPRLFSSISLNWPNVIFSYLFLLSPNSLGTIGAVTQTGWTLCFEAYFYLVFAVLLILPRRYFLVATGLIFGLGLFISLFTTVPPWASVAVSPLVIEFYLGSIIAFLFLRGFVLPPAVAVLAIIIGAATLGLVSPSNESEHVWSWGVASGLILISAVSLEHFGVRVPKLLIALGASSYSLYLVHPFVFAALGKAWSLMHLSSVPAFIPGIIAFAVALSAGHGVYLWLELPVTEWLKTGWRPARAKA